MYPPAQEETNDMSFPPDLGITSSLFIKSSSSVAFQEVFSRSNMNGYSRIRKGSTTRSKSVDFADLSFPPQPPRSTASNSKFKPQDAKPNLIKTIHSIPEHEPEDGGGEDFGIILGRKGSDSNPPLQDMAAEPESSLFQTVGKRTLSIARSSSVSEGYSRIQPQSDFTAEDDPDDQSGTQFTTKKRPLKSKGKFLEACKRFFRL